ncbi:MAG: cbb3-type cytochrome oxidase assembly protein CcoS [Cellvibrionaceae bacterium]|uniref:cbb3-type cytochrome oxidase assembly protein CcoS n=1 Tax=uncultured Pseudoteredinibacter sp. TaxID=1641701 RepID=UPI00262ACBA3|nr:cbb3-type cytochrome oxidase assembly protein CcoS [uncultured Pseudoteredinibacter sp.]MCV6622930.1 cbb3-type cytochrome oxidase assembly protein CcoS [Cellvibrionaceae bacterium]
MDSLYILIPIAIVFVIVAAKVFFWAVDNHQFDDLDTEGQRILFDEEKPAPKQEKRQAESSESSNPD